VQWKKKQLVQWLEQQLAQWKEEQWLGQVSLAERLGEINRTCSGDLCCY
jgi:hypothetical protein